MPQGYDSMAFLNKPSELATFKSKAAQTFFRKLIAD
jgi:hypothetical protein